MDLEKYFIELNCIELRDRVVKVKREIEDMDRFEEEEKIKNIRPIKYTSYDWILIFLNL